VGPHDEPGGIPGSIPEKLTNTT